MKKTLPLLSVSLSLGIGCLQAQVPVKPTHIVIVIDENHSFTDIIGSSSAPTFTALSMAANTAAFNNDNSDGNYPGEPNALEYFSGSTQGVTGDDNGPAPGAPFNDCNLGSSLLLNGFTFIGYAEEQPRLGWIEYDTLEYITHHIPWINWVGYNTNPDTIPLVSVVPFSHIAPYTTGPIFPDSNGYDSLPTLAIVVPDGDNDMHDGTIAQGDAWFNTNIMPYVRWTNDSANNSLLIVVWADGGSSNNVPLLVCGAMVRGGIYSDSESHFTLCRTIEDMYSLPECANSDSTADTKDWPVRMWKGYAATGINSVTANIDNVKTYPVPAKNVLNISINSNFTDQLTISLNDITGREIMQLSSLVKSGSNIISLNTSVISGGVYLLSIKVG